MCKRWRIACVTPYRSPAKTDEELAARVVAALRKAPCFRARRLVDTLELPVGKNAAHRIVRDAQLVVKARVNKSASLVCVR